MAGSPPVNQDLDLENKVQMYKVQLRDDEEVFEIVPKHIGKIFLPLIGSVVLVVVAVIILFILLFTATLSTFFILTLFGLFALISLAAIVYAISNWVSYMASALIITSQRVIDVDQKHLFSKVIQESDIHTVRNLTNEYHKPFGQFFYYGNVTIERMSADPLIIQAVPVPKVIANQIMHYHNVVVHGGIATAHNFTAEKMTEDKTPDLEKVTHEAKEIAKQQGIPVKG